MQSDISGAVTDVSGAVTDVSGSVTDVSGAGISGETVKIVEKKSVVARRMIAEVEEALKTQTPAQVSAQFSDYQSEFPKLFAILLNRDYPRDVLSLMLLQLEKIEAGKTSQHDASVAVGSVLVNQFVKPQLGLSSQK